MQSVKHKLCQSSRSISSFLFSKSIPPSSSAAQSSFHSISFSKPNNFSQPTTANFYTFLSNLSTNFKNHEQLRNFSGESEPGLDHSKEIDEINLKFAEAREEIESAMESKETVYFDDEAECARAAVKEVLDLFNGLLDRLPESEKGVVQRSMGLKIEQLKAELAQLDE